MIKTLNDYKINENVQGSKMYAEVKFTIEEHMTKLPTLCELNGREQRMGQVCWKTSYCK